MTSTKLHFRTVGEGKPTIILHGLFGSGDNWLNIAKSIEGSHQIFLIDQRNHGRSFHDDEMDYEQMASDIVDFIGEKELENVHLIGHSMGGKVCMQIAQEHAELIEKLVVVDIAPRSYPSRHQEIFDALKSIDLVNLSSRSEAEQQLESRLDDTMINLFLLKSLYKDEAHQFKWRFNLNSIIDNYSKLTRSQPSTSVFMGKTLFIKGMESDYILAEDQPVIRNYFPNVQAKIIQGAGHWPHAEKPALISRILNDFLNSD